MRLLLVLAVLTVACKSKRTGDDDRPPPPPRAAPATVPTTPGAVAPAAQVAPVLSLAKLPRPRRIVWIDAAGALEAAEPTNPWNGTLPATHTPIANADALAALDASRTAGPTAADPWAVPVSPDENRGSDRLLAARGDLRPHDDAFVMIASPSSPALTLAQLVVRFGGSIGVVRGDQVLALRINYRRATVDQDADTTRQPWIELHLDAEGVHVVSLPMNGQSLLPWSKGTVDAVGLRAIYLGFGNQAPLVDVFVGAGVPAQRLVDVLIALDQLGVTALGLGESTGSITGRHEELEAARLGRTGLRTKTAWLNLGQPNAQGDLDKRVIRRIMRQHMAEIMPCYETALAKAPELRGTVSLMFFINPDGKLSSSTAVGVDPSVASCIADHLKAFAFPTPRGGGGVLVNFPITFGPMAT